MSDILTAGSSLPTLGTIPLIVSFFKRKLLLQLRAERPLLLRPWEEQYQIHFAKSICIISKDVLAAIDKHFFFSHAFNMVLYPCSYPPGSLITMSNAFSHFTEILWWLGCRHKGKDKQVEGQCTQRDCLYIAWYNTCDHTTSRDPSCGHCIIGRFNIHHQKWKQRCPWRQNRTFFLLCRMSVRWWGAGRRCMEDVKPLRDLQVVWQVQLSGNTLYVHTFTVN